MIIRVENATMQQLGWLLVRIGSRIKKRPPYTKKSPLSAVRVYVISKLGNEVQVPDEIHKNKIK
jgi:hypothetical protein